MTKKIILNIIMIGMITVFSGCDYTNENESNDYDEATVLQEENMINDLWEKDFMLENEDFNFYLGMKCENFALYDIDDLEDDTDPLSFWIVKDDYVMEVGKGRERILFLKLKTSKYETTRGVSVGDSLSDMLESYGYDYSHRKSNSKEFYTYRYDGKILKFTVDENQTIVSITFELF